MGVVLKHEIFSSKLNKSQKKCKIRIIQSKGIDPDPQKWAKITSLKAGKNTPNVVVAFLELGTLFVVTLLKSWVGIRRELSVNLEIVEDILSKDKIICKV